jgi:hypothetical protein
MPKSRTTPGPGEYLLAYLASVACFAICFAVVVTATTHPFDPAIAAAAVVVATMYTTMCSIPFALVGIPLVHLIGRRVESQGGQVVITGGVTVLVVGVGVGLLTSSSDAGVWVGAGTALATMAGRAAVIPLVRRQARSHPWEVPYR